MTEVEWDQYINALSAARDALDMSAGRSTGEAGFLLGAEIRGMDIRIEALIDGRHEQQGLGDARMDQLIESMNGPQLIELRRRVVNTASTPEGRERMATFDLKFSGVARTVARQMIRDGAIAVGDISLSQGDAKERV